VGSRAINPIAQWDIFGQQFPSVRQWAFDTLSCPATSYECERAFSSAKRLITADRNALADDLIQALECLKAWGAEHTSTLDTKLAGVLSDQGRYEQGGKDTPTKHSGWWRRR
jgi:hypothetical protein